MSSYDRSRILISLHIPKTAGTSLRMALSDWFGDDLALHYRGDRGEPPERALPRPGLCVHGHFNRCRGLGALEFYPEASQFVVFLRHPFDRFVSQWRYLGFQRRSGIIIPELEDDPSFAQWFDRRQAASEAGEDPFSFLAQLPRPIRTFAEADRAFGPEFLFVGTVERYEASLGGLADSLGFARPAPVHVNRASEDFRRGDPTESYDGYREGHEAAFPMEYRVYAAAVDWGRPDVPQAAAR